MCLCSFIQGQQSPVGKSTTFSLSAGMLPGVAVTESCHCRRVCPLQQGLSPAAPAGLGAPSKGEGPVEGAPAQGLAPSCSWPLPWAARAVLWAGQGHLWPWLCSGDGAPGSGCTEGTAGTGAPEGCLVCCEIHQIPQTPHRWPGIPVPAHSHRTQQHLHGSLAPHLCCACPGLQSSEQALGLSSPQPSC